MKPDLKCIRFVYCLLTLFQTVFFINPASAKPSDPSCFSCRIEIKSLARPVNLQGNWLFTREDNPENAKPETPTSDWVVIPTPGPWNAAYKDGKLFTVGWYRGEFHFAESLIGKEAVFFVDAYMSRLEVFLDGESLFHRQGRDSFQKYFSIQPVPLRFKITQKHHVISFRVNTSLMTGVYQSPFQLRPFKNYDPVINFFEIFCGEMRYIFAYIFFWTGLFFLLLYFYTRYSLYLISGLTGIGVFPFYAMPNDINFKFFHPEVLLLLHYPGIGFMALGFFWFSRSFYKTNIKISIIYSVIISLYALAFIYLAFDMHLAFFQIARKSLFIVAYIIWSHGTVLCIKAYRKDKRIGLGVVGFTLLWFSSGHDILLALGYIKSFSLIFIGTFTATSSVMLITARIFAQVFQQNRRLVRDLARTNENLEETVSIRTRSLEDKTREITSILESLPQGVIEADCDLKILRNFSRASYILGEPNLEGANVLELLCRDSDVSQDSFEMAKAILFMAAGEDAMHFEVNQGNLPREILRKCGAHMKSLSLAWTTINDEANQVVYILVTVTDISEKKAFERELSVLRVKNQVVEALIQNNDSRILTIVQEALKRIADYRNGQDLTAVRMEQLYRALHTLKGNARTYGLIDVSNQCHTAESALQRYKDDQKPIHLESLKIDLGNLTEALQSLENFVIGISQNFTPQGASTSVAIDRTLYDCITTELLSNPNPAEIKKRLQQMRYQPAFGYFKGLDERYGPLAAELGKPPVNFEVLIPNGLYLDPNFGQSLSDMLGHLIRNSMDHGLESVEERKRLHKPSAGRIAIRLVSTRDAVVFEYADDGSGLNLLTIRDKASQKGLCARDEANTERIVSCIFAPNFSTKKHVTTSSGRGVGMDVVKSELDRWRGQMSWKDLDGTIDSRRNVPFHVIMYFPASLVIMVRPVAQSVA